MPEPAIITRGLTKRYGEFTAVKKLDLQVEAGEIFGLLGPNGAGKTTTILMLLGLSEPSEGGARVAGLDPTRDPLGVKKIVGYLPDNVGFYPTLTGRQNLTYTADLNRLDSKSSRSKIEELLSQVGLEEAADEPAGNYSRGMRQRLGIADALVKDPEILILDEPTIGIDPEGVVDILSLVKDLPTEKRVTILLSSHLLYQVQEICDRVGIFSKGRLVVEGTVPELAARFSVGDSQLELAVEDWERAGAMLKGVPGIKEIDRQGRHWIIHSDRDLASEIGRLFADSGLPILHMRRRGDALDEIYVRYFGGEKVDASD
jgi:ABC-2 type transport system ATP-binding protein